MDRIAETHISNTLPRTIRPRQGVESLIPCYHGGPDYIELETYGIALDQVKDFSSNTNPFGPPPGVKEALSKVDISQYPDSNATELRRALTLNLGIGLDSIIVGAGSTELIRLLALAYLGVGDKVVIIDPAFGEYEAACAVVGASAVRHNIARNKGFQLKVRGIVSLIKKSSPKIVFLCNPNNPTGQYLEKHEVETILQVTEGGLVVLDEAYIPFVEEPWSSLDLLASGNLVILRSMTKDFALTGLRLGYAIAWPEIISNLRRVCPPWNVNILALRAGMIALETGEYLNRCAKELKQAKDYLVEELSSLGYRILPSRANFFMMEVGDAAKLRQGLLKQGFLVRDCTSFGLPRYVRIAPRTIPECEALVEAIRESNS
ncbi:MAG: histidinol-phosphate transaminase [Chloroflexota bacterium]|nr:histidinol-phosphate transaminase [Chloroflexota bacterium]